MIRITHNKNKKIVSGDLNKQQVLNSRDLLAAEIY